MTEQRQRILQINTVDIGGGSAKVAWSLFAAYRLRGHRSWLAVGRKRSTDPDVHLIPDPTTRGLWFRFWCVIASRLERLDNSAPLLERLGRLAHLMREPGGWLDYVHGAEDLFHPGTWRLLTLAGQPSVVHGHNLHGGYFDLRALPWLSRHVPVVLTLHDAWLLSGHCAHSFDCERWTTGCGHCPDLTIYPAIRRDATNFNWRRKSEVYARSRLHVAAPSRWLMHKVESSMLAPALAETRVIPNGVDLTVFRPTDMQAARLSLDIPQDARVLLFVAETARRNMWKDYATIRDAVALASERLRDQNILFIALGGDGRPERIGRAEARCVAYQNDPQVVARFYQAADVYVHAARADTFPNTVLEAMACGTPVVATAVGGIPEQVEEARTGFLVRPRDGAGMAGRLAQVLSDADLRQRMGSAGVESARSRFDVQQQVDAYLDWYAQLSEGEAPVATVGRP
jgi:glycosyltransferase involved in cell wall biosynthesis